MPATITPEFRSASVPTAWPVANSATRFTLNGSDALELHLANVCQNALAGTARIIPTPELVGLALGGGYGRGEGGVLRTPAGDQLYNDLEFYVFVSGLPWWNERRYAKALHELGEELSVSAGVELEFKITSRAKLQRSSQSLFYHDLLMGHRWLLGDDNLLGGHAAADEPLFGPALRARKAGARVLLSR
jgi:hypothetical protein